MKRLFTSLSFVIISLVLTGCPDPDDKRGAAPVLNPFSSEAYEYKTCGLLEEMEIAYNCNFLGTRCEFVDEPVVVDYNKMVSGEPSITRIQPNNQLTLDHINDLLSNNTEETVCVYSHVPKASFGDMKTILSEWVEVLESFSSSSFHQSVKQTLQSKASDFNRRFSGGKLHR